MNKLIVSLLFLFMSTQLIAIDGVLIQTIDYSFKEKWERSSSSSVTLAPTCRTVYKKQNFFITALASNFAADEENISNVHFSISIFKPDGGLFFSKEGLQIVWGKIENRDFLHMGDAILKIRFEEEDSFGKYPIIIDITDDITGKSKRISSEVILAKLPSFDSFQVKKDNVFLEWISNYSKNPEPEKALAYYVYFSQNAISDKESSFWPAFSFFLEIAKNNSFLLPQIMNCYATQDTKTKIYLLYLLTLSEIGDHAFFETLKGDEEETYLMLKNSPQMGIYGIISSPSQLDMLWGAFMASGSYKPILKLIQTLDYVKYSGFIEKYENSERTEEDKQNAINEAIYTSLVWSIKSNCEQQQLVKDYCAWALLYEELTDVQKSELTEILK